MTFPVTEARAAPAPLTKRRAHHYGHGRRFGREIDIMFRHRWLIALAAIATALVLVAADAQARAGGFSGGSRGLRTFSPPPSTSTAPNSAAPIQRAITQ